MVLKCKMCGGDLDITPEMTVCECEYCGSKQTVPTIDDEKKLKLYERANKLRSACEFDKAYSVYESIVGDFSDDAEAYWGLILCKYGIEYVDDPGTGRKVPTCHRSSYDCVLDDENFEMVMENSDTLACDIYREQAKEIEEIRKRIISVSSTEQPYDIFICYKETDFEGERTLDSVLAQDVYDALVQKGYRVFFSRISLEDKIGQEYEPFIFAALNSAKIMLAFGTDYKYYNAVWVKNEWSRYLKLMTKDSDKHLIPCYKGLDAYDLPKEFQKLQAQDMGKVGATQDLLRGIDKILGGDRIDEDILLNKNVTTTVQDIKDVVAKAVANNTGVNVNALLERGYIILDDGDYESADTFFEEVLNQNPKCAEAYLGKLLVREKCANTQILKEKYVSKYVTKIEERHITLNTTSDFIDKVIGDNVVPGYLEKNEISREMLIRVGYNSVLDSCRQYRDKQINELNEDKLLIKIRKYAQGNVKEEIEEIYNYVCDFWEKRIREAKNNDENNEKKIKKEYKLQVDKALKKIEKMKEESLITCEKEYSEIVKNKNNCKTIEDYENIIKVLKKFGGYRDSNKLICECEMEIDKININRNKKRIFKIEIAVALIIIVASGYGVTIYAKKVWIPKNLYEKCIDLIDDKNYSEALNNLKALKEYKEYDEQVIECKYKIANNLQKSEKFEDARKIFEELGDYEDSKSKLEQTIKDQAQNLYEDGCYEDAYVLLNSSGDPLDAELSDKCAFELSEVFLNNSKFEEALEWIGKTRAEEYDSYLIDYYDKYGDYLKEQGNLKKAIEMYEKSGNKSERNKLEYKYAVNNLDNKNTYTYRYLTDLYVQDYKDTQNICKTLYALKLDVFFNMSESDHKTRLSSFSIDDEIYVHIKVTGGYSNSPLDFDFTHYEEWSDGHSGYNTEPLSNKVVFGKWIDEYIYPEYGLSIQKYKVVVSQDGVALDSIYFECSYISK